MKKVAHYLLKMANSFCEFLFQYKCEGCHDIHFDIYSLIFLLYNANQVLILNTVKNILIVDIVRNAVRNFEVEDIERDFVKSYCSNKEEESFVNSLPM